MRALMIVLVVVALGAAAWLLLGDDGDIGGVDAVGAGDPTSPGAAGASGTADQDPVAPKPFEGEDDDVPVSRRAVVGRVIAKGDGAPIEGATVTIRSFGKRGESREVRTDDAGRFRLTGMRLGAWVQAFVVAEGYGRHQGGSRVAGGDRTLDIDCGDLELEPESRITGRVVEEGTRRPLAGVAITAGSEYALGSPLTVSTTSAGDGSFILRGAAAMGLLDVTFRAKGFAEKRLVIPQHRRKPGETLDLEEVTLGRGTHLHGHVVAKGSGAGLKAAFLLADQRITGHLFSLGNARFLGRSAEDGSFSFENVPPSRSQEYVLLAFAGTHCGWLRLGSLAGEKSKELRVELETGAPLTVRVESDDGPVEGAEVSCLPRLPDVSRFNAQVRSRFFRDPPEIMSHVRAETGDDGVARIAVAPILHGPRTVDVIVWKEGYVVSRTKMNHPGPGRPGETTVRLRRNVKLSLEGVVKDDAGRPIPGASVTLLLAAQIFVTDAQGRYRFTGIGATQTRHHVTVQKDGWAAKTDVVDLKLDGPNVHDFVLRRGRGVRGIVVDETGKGIPGVGLSITPKDGVRAVSRGVIARTGDGGRFETNAISDGAWILSVNYLDAGEDFVRPFPKMELSGGRDDVRIELRRYDGPRVAFTAKVVEAGSGEPLPVERASLEPRDRSGTWHVPRAKASRGRVTSETLGPGDWTLTVKVADGREVTHPFSVAEGETEKTITVEVARPGRVTYKLRYAGPRPARRGSAWASQPSWGADARWQRLARVTERYAPVGDDDVVRFMEIRPGRFHVRFTAKGYIADHTLKMTPGGDLSVDVEMKAPGRLRISGTAPQGTKRIMVQVRAPGTDGGYQRSFAGKDGGPFDHELDVLPGEVEWRVVFRGGNGTTIDTQDGTATAREGEIVAVTVE